MPGAAAPQLRHSAAGAGLASGGCGRVGHGAQATEQLVDARENPAQDIDLFLLQAGAGEQTAQPREQPLRLARIEEAHRHERAFGAGVERLDLVERRRFETRRRPDPLAMRRDKQLVGRDLHRRREVERGLSRRAGNRRHDLAVRKLGVRQPRHLGAEYQRHLAHRRVRDRFHRCGAH